jgi:tetratricopeptide (TPR) repeat protein
LWSKGRVEDARTYFDACKRVDFAPFFLARGHFYWATDIHKTQLDFEQAVKIDPQRWKTWHTLIDFFSAQEMPEKALETALEAAQLFPKEDVIKVDLVRALIGNERSSEAADILENLEILPSEGASDVHRLFVRCHVNLGVESIQGMDFERALYHLGKAKTYPENLGSGQPYEPDQRMQDYLIAHCYEETDRREKAEEIKKAIYNFTKGHLSAQGEHQYFGGLVMIDLGERNKGRELMRKNPLPEDLQKKIHSIIN